MFKHTGQSSSMPQSASSSTFWGQKGGLTKGGLVASRYSVGRFRGEVLSSASPAWSGASKSFIMKAPQLV
eukprot:1856297-Amphidinium_carterae.1